MWEMIDFICLLKRFLIYCDVDTSFIWICSFMDDEDFCYVIVGKFYLK